jgi:uncharacterized membrane protein YfcA
MEYMDIFNSTLLILVFIILIASFIRAISGFGFALVATPLMTLVIDAKTSVVISVLLGIAAGIMVLSHVRQHVDARKVLYLSLGAVPGIFIGTYLLVNFSSATIKLWIAIVVMVSTIPMVLGRSFHFSHDKIGCVIAGFIGGVLSASTSLGGPPIVLYLLNQKLPKEKFVATITAYFMVTGVISMGSLTLGGVVTGDALFYALLMLPVTYLGSYIGVRVLPKIDAKLFRIITTGIVMITALIIVVTFITGSGK